MMHKTKQEANEISKKEQNSPRFPRALAIRLKCIDCSGGKLAEVRKCPIKECSLWEYRLGAGRTEPLEDDSPVHGRDM